MTDTTPLAFPPAARQPLGRAVADSLRDAIYAGQLRPGQRIGQAVVARQLGVSQTTVREALSTLEHEGLVAREVNQGAVVSELSPEDVEEVVTLRTDLEAMAVRLLIRRGDPEHLAALRRNVRAMKAAAGAGALADLDLDFHELLVRLAGHKRLLACWQSLRTQIKLLLVTNNLRNPRSLRATVQDHEELLRRLEARDEAGAVAHLEQGNRVHLMHARPE